MDSLFDFFGSIFGMQGEALKGLVAGSLTPQDLLIIGLWLLAVTVFVITVWINRHKILFNCVLYFKSLTEGGMRRNILGLLVKKQYQIDVYHVAKEDRTLLCKTRLRRVGATSMEMRVLQNVAMTRQHVGKMVTCFHRPVLFLYWVYNSFDTYPVEFVDNQDPSKAKLVLKMPLKIEAGSRRVHRRERIRNQDLVKVRAWIRCDETQGGNFRFMKPHFQIGIEDKEKGKTPGRVDNLSVGGMRLSVHADSVTKPVADGDQICVELYLFNWQAREYDTFMMNCEVRSLNLDTKGYLHLGLQFVSIGRINPGSRQLVWEGFEFLDGCGDIGRAMGNMRQ